MVKIVKKSRHYKPLSVIIEYDEDRRASWAWDRRKIKGTEFIYGVLDKNFDRLNKWKFSVKVPQEAGQVVVQPLIVPGKKAFAEVKRRSIIFQKATRMPHRKNLYCKVHLADPSMERNWVGTTRGDREQFPDWFNYFRPHMRLKKTVTTTAGNDGNDQVVLIKPDDHKRMIRLFFALRVWVLQECIILE